MKAIMLSIRPEWVVKILNGEKTIEVRKKFPKDFVGWVYIYCCKQRKNEIGFHINYEKVDGKVVARFWCDKVEEISYNYRSDFTSVYTDTLDTEDLEKQACLTRQEFAKYLKSDYGYAIHITKLEIFDKPKELWKFKTPKNAEKYKHDLDKAYEDDYEVGTRIAEGIANDDECANGVELTELSEGYYGLKHGPQNFCYVEVENNEF